MYRIAKTLNRSSHTIKDFLSKPEVVTAVRDEKSELARVYKEKARKVVESISDTDISKASLQQKSISSGILLDKSLLLTGEGPASINVTVLLDVAQMIRGARDAQDPRRTLPALPKPEQK